MGQFSLQIYYAEHVFDEDALTRWLDVERYDRCQTWEDIKVVLRRRFAPPLESKRKVAVACGPNSLATEPINS